MKTVLLGLLLMIASVARANCDRLDKKIVGKWFSDKQNESVEIFENGNLNHSRAGAGDLRHIAGDRYELTLYSARSGKAMRSCMVVLTHRTDGTLNALNTNNSPECNLGVLQPVATRAGEPGSDRTDR